MNSTHGHVLALVLVSILLAPLRGEEPSSPGLRLHDVQAQVLASYPEVEAARTRYRAARAREGAADALPDPMLQVTQFGESVQTRTGPQERVYLFSQSVPWPGKLRGRAVVADSETARAEAALRAVELRVIRAASSAFYEYGYTGKAIELTGENLDWLRQLLPVVEVRVQGGGGLDALLRLKLEIGKLTDRLQGLEQTRILQSARLGEYLGQSNGALLDWPDWSAPDPDPESGLPVLDPAYPELQALARQREAAAGRARLARLESYPDLSAGFTYIEVGDPVVNPATPGAGEDPWGVTVGIRIPLGVSRNRAARAEAEAMVKTAEAETGTLLRELDAEVRTVAARLQDARRRMVTYGEELPGLARQSLEINRSGYENGQTPIQDLIDSQRALLSLELDYWRAAADAAAQHVILSTYTGALTPEDISHEIEP